MNQMRSGFRPVRCLVSLFWISAVLLSLTSPLFADGESRPATAAEQAASLRMRTVMEKALPPGPPGWEEMDRTACVPAKRVAADQESFPMSAEYFVHWQDRSRVAAADQKMEAALPAMSGLVTPDQEMTRLQARFEALVTEASAAVEKGDMARFATLQQQMEALSLQINQNADHRQGLLEREIALGTPQDVDLKVYLETNRFTQDFNDPLSETATMAGLPLIRAGEGEQTGTGWHEGYTYVFLGDFSLKDDDGPVRMAAAERKGLSHTAVQTLVVRVQGDQARARAFLEAVDWQALKALLSP